MYLLATFGKFPVPNSHFKQVVLSKRTVQVMTLNDTGYILPGLLIGNGAHILLTCLCSWQAQGSAA